MRRCVGRQIIYLRTYLSFRNFLMTNFNFFSEIASRNPHSFATDVWSLGILIATLLTGRPPFDTDSINYFDFLFHEK